MSREDIQTNIRLPVELKDALSRECKENRRSLSAEIIDRLNKSFVPDGFTDSVAKQIGIDGQHHTGWRSQQEADQKRDDAVYGVLVKVADTLAESNRSIEVERNLLADVIRLMGKLRDKYYWFKS